MVEKYKVLWGKSSMHKFNMLRNARIFAEVKADISKKRVEITKRVPCKPPTANIRKPCFTRKHHAFIFPKRR